MTATLIGIAGVPCAGKTTLCMRLEEKPGITCLRMEDFYKGNELIPRYRNFRNYDSPLSIDFEALGRTIKSLKRGESVDVPVYSKDSAGAVGIQKITAAGIIIVEGFLLFVKKEIRDLFDVRIFMDVDQETQLMRKKGRNAGLDSNLEYYNKVLVPMSKKHVVPTKKYADYILDGTKTIDELTTELIDILSNLNCYSKNIS